MRRDPGGVLECLADVHGPVYTPWTAKHWGFWQYRLGTTPPRPPRVHPLPTPCYSGLSVGDPSAQRLADSVKTVISGSPTYHPTTRPSTIEHRPSTIDLIDLINLSYILVISQLYLSYNLYRWAMLQGGNEEPCHNVVRRGIDTVPSARVTEYTLNMVIFRVYSWQVYMALDRVSENLYPIPHGGESARPK